MFTLLNAVNQYFILRLRTQFIFKSVSVLRLNTQLNSFKIRK
ncbi:hypothetical protein M23134_08084 [Microscilla marina ATCC 23134]|uniref:Uncharacterized protein n=1 Tax=Microscilla marina ATCC 23134 TaxID=313606 RepID=A1ZGZ1_MICM2|nr:hypothetical protein M23134_08084 [Microscilla marina ATCC 23134]